MMVLLLVGTCGFDHTPGLPFGEPGRKAPAAEPAVVECAHGRRRPCFSFTTPWRDGGRLRLAGSPNFSAITTAAPSA